MNKASGYCKVSTFEQTKGVSLESQKEAIQKYCEIYNWELTNIYEDAGVSGAKDDRPALLEMLQDAKDKRFSKLIFFKLDRLGRSVKQILQNYDKLEKMGVAIISLKENIDTSSPMGRLFRTILAGFSEFEREVIAERTLMGRMGSLKEKRRYIFERMYGYRWDKEKKIFELIPEEAEIIKKFFDYYAHENLSYNSVSMKLQGEGIRRITSSQIRKIINREAYMTGRIYTNTTRKENGKRGPTPKSEWYKFDCPKIIEPKIFKKAFDNQTRNANFPRHYEKEGDPFLLRGLMKSHCGKSMMVATINQHRYYICIGRWMGKPSPKNALPTKDMKRKRCDCPYIPAEKMEEQFMNETLYFLTNPRRALTRNKERLGGTSLDPEKVKGQIRSLEIKIGQEDAKINRWLELYGEEKMTKENLYFKHDEAKTLMEKWKMEKDILQNSLENFGVNKARLQEVKESFDDLKGFSSKIREIFDKMSFEMKKEFLNSIFESRSIEVWDVRRRMEEEGILFKGKENSFELRGIEGLSLERVLFNNDDSFTIQPV